VFLARPTRRTFVEVVDPRLLVGNRLLVACQLIGGFRDEGSKGTAAGGGVRTTTIAFVVSTMERSILPSLTDAALELGPVHGVRPGAAGGLLHHGPAMSTEGREWRETAAVRTANLARVLVRHSPGIVHGPAGAANRSPIVTVARTIAGSCGA
jgi:hypothetical protein